MGWKKATDFWQNIGRAFRNGNLGAGLELWKLSNDVIDLTSISLLLIAEVNKWTVSLGCKFHVSTLAARQS